MWRLSSLVLLSLVLVVSLLSSHLPSARSHADNQLIVDGLTSLRLSSPLRRILLQVEAADKGKSSRRTDDTNTPHTDNGNGERRMEVEAAGGEGGGGGGGDGEGEGKVEEDGAGMEEQQQAAQTLAEAATQQDEEDEDAAAAATKAARAKQDKEKGKGKEKEKEEAVTDEEEQEEATADTSTLAVAGQEEKERTEEADEAAAAETDVATHTGEKKKEKTEEEEPEEKTTAVQPGRPGGGDSRRNSSSSSSSSKSSSKSSSESEGEEDNQASTSPSKSQTTAGGSNRGRSPAKRGASQPAEQQQRHKQTGGSKDDTDTHTHNDTAGDTSVDNNEVKPPTETEDADTATTSSSSRIQKEDATHTTNGGQARADQTETETTNGADRTEGTVNGNGQHKHSDAHTAEREKDTTVRDDDSVTKRVEAGEGKEQQTADSAKTVCPPTNVALTATQSPSEADDEREEDGVGEGSLAVSFTASPVTAGCVTPSSYVIEYSAFPHFPRPFTVSQRVDATTNALTLPSTAITPGVRYYVRVSASAADADSEAAEPIAASGQDGEDSEQRPQPTVSEPTALALPLTADEEGEGETVTSAISMCDAVVTASMAHSEAAHTILSLRSLRAHLTTLLHIRPPTDGGQRRIGAIHVTHNADTQRDEATLTIRAPHSSAEQTTTTVDSQDAEAALAAVASDDKSALYTQPAWVLAELLKFSQLGARAYTTAAHIERVDAVRLNCTNQRTQSRQPTPAEEPVAVNTHQSGSDNRNTVVDTAADDAVTSNTNQQDEPAAVPKEGTDHTAGDSNDDTADAAHTHATPADTTQQTTANEETNTEKESETEVAGTDAAADTNTNTAAHTQTNQQETDTPAAEQQQQPTRTESDNTPVAPNDTPTHHDHHVAQPNTDANTDTVDPAADNQPPAANQPAADDDHNTHTHTQQQPGDNRQHNTDASNQPPPPPPQQQQQQQEDETEPAQRNTEEDTVAAGNRPGGDGEDEVQDDNRGGRAADVADKGRQEVSQPEGSEREQQAAADAFGSSSSSPEDLAAVRVANRSSTLLGFLFSHTLAAALILAACMGTIVYCVFVRSTDNGGFAPLRQSDTDIERGMAGGHSTNSHSSSSQHTNQHSASSSASTSTSQAGSSDRSLVEVDDEQQYQLALLRHSDTAPNGGLHFLEDVLTRLGIPSYGQAAFSQKLRDHYLTTIQQIEALDAADWKRINLPLVIEEAVRKALEDRHALIEAGGEANIASSANKSKAAAGLSLKHSAAPHKKIDRDSRDTRDSDSVRKDDKKAGRTNGGSAEKASGKKKPLVSEPIDDEQEEDMEGWADDF